MLVNLFYLSFSINISAKFFEFEIFKSKKAPNKLLLPTSFKIAGGRIFSAATIFEGSKRISCTFASYRSFLELNFRRFFEN